MSNRSGFPRLLARLDVAVRTGCGHASLPADARRETRWVRKFDVLWRIGRQHKIDVVNPAAEQPRGGVACGFACHDSPGDLLGSTGEKRNIGMVGIQTGSLGCLENDVRRPLGPSRCLDDTGFVTQRVVDDHGGVPPQHVVTCFDHAATPDRRRAGSDGSFRQPTQGLKKAAEVLIHAATLPSRQCFLNRPATRDPALIGQATSMVSIATIHWLHVSCTHRRHWPETLRPLVSGPVFVADCSARPSPTKGARRVGISLADDEPENQVNGGTPVGS